MSSAFVDLAHSALADLLGDLVMRDGLSDHVLCSAPALECSSDQGRESFRSRLRRPAE